MNALARRRERARLPRDLRSVPYQQVDGTLPRYSKDESTRGRPYKVVAISLPVDELSAVDPAATRHRMARSHFLREAAKFYAAHLDSTVA